MEPHEYNLLVTKRICGHLVDVASGEIHEHQCLVVDSGRIAEISRVRGSGVGFLLPGLIDAHVHLVLEPSSNYPAFDPQELTTVRYERAKRNARATLVAGVTTVRDCGFPTNEIFALREKMRQRPELGARIVAAGPLITTPGGHARKLGLEARGENKMRQAVDRVLSLGVDFVKLINNDPHGFSVEEMRAAVERAHARGKKVACHLYQEKVLERVLQTGIDMIEHFCAASPLQVQQIKDKSVMVTLTYEGALDAVRHPEANVLGDETIDAEIETSFDDWVVQLEQGVRLLLKNGNLIATGTDAGFLYTEFDTVIREVLALVKLGASPLQALQAATIAAAKVVGLENRIGSLEVEKLADVVVYERNPLEDLTVLKHPVAVYKEGRLVQDVS